MAHKPVRPQQCICDLSIQENTIWCSEFTLYTFATFHHHLHLYDTPLSHKIRSNLYVDSIVTGCETESQAVQFFQEARSMMCNAGFNLRTWASNNESLTRKALEDSVGSKLQLTNILVYNGTPELITYP